MSYQTPCMMEIGEPCALDFSEPWVREVLEPDQLTTTKMSYGRCKLNRGTLLLLWGLRVYVVFMVFIVGLAVLNALRPVG